MKDIGPGHTVGRTWLTPSGVLTGPTTSLGTQTTVAWWCYSETTSGGRTEAVWPQLSRRRLWLPSANMIAQLPQQAPQPQTSQLPQSFPVPLDGKNLKVIATCSLTQPTGAGTVLKQSVLEKEVIWPRYIPMPRWTLFGICHSPPLVPSGWEDQTTLVR